jgi:membrane protease YdiL (CAAX protease family)
MSEEPPSLNPEPAAAPDSSPAPSEAEKIPCWGYSDLLLFFGLAVPAMVVGWALTRGVFMLLGLHFAVSAVEAIAAQSAIYGILFGAFGLVFRMQYERPFWRSLGWISFRMPVISVAALGVLTAVAVALLGTFLQIPNSKNTLTQLMEDRAGFALMAAFGITLGPFFEEMAFRGLAQPLLVRSLGAVPGIICAAIPFGLLHYQEYGNSWKHAAVVATAGAAFGWMRHASGSTKASVIMHSAYNALFFAAFFVQKKEF